MNRITFATLGLLVAILLAACTPSATPPPPTEAVMDEAPASPTAEVAPPTEAVPPPTEEVAEAVEIPTEEPPAEEPLPMPTSRGDSLVATNPATVNLASGEPQLIEFFAFW